MEPSKEPINVRITRLNQLFLSQPGTVSSFDSSQYLGREGLLDSLVVLYDECNNEHLKKEKKIASFVSKFCGVILELKSLRVNLSDFELKKVIGRGQFGEVTVVREKQTGDVYAMKILRKCGALSQEGAFCYQEERDIMAQTCSPWLTRLQYAFQDTSNLYLVMEFHPGGDLLALLDRFDGSVTEEMARFYLAELAVAINDLHNMGFVHRDIKPENILLDRCGHVKLVDFGSAARLSAAGVVTNPMVVGTPEYIAPEVLHSLNDTQTGKYNKQKLYGSECDYWSLGIVAFEMVVGYTPFVGDNIAVVYNAIMNHEKTFDFPDKTSSSPGFCRFIGDLLVNAENRLNHERLQNHSFFSTVEWSELLNCTPPFIPVVTSEDDTSNFFEMEWQPPRPSVENSKVLKEFSGKDLPFIGFTSTPKIGLSPMKGIPQMKIKNPCESNGKEVMEELEQKLEKCETKVQRITILERRLQVCCGKLEVVEKERAMLENQLVKGKHEAQCLKRTLDLEHAQQKTLEIKAKALITESKANWEAKKQDDLNFLRNEIKAKDQKLTALLLEKEDLEGKLQSSDAELQLMKSEVQRLQESVEENKLKMEKVRKKSRESIAGVETRLEEITLDKQQLTGRLQKQLLYQTSLSSDLKSQLKHLEKTSTKKVEKVLSQHDQTSADKKKLQREVEKLKSKCVEFEKTVENLQEKHSIERTNVLTLKSAMQSEKEMNISLKEQLESLRKEKQELELRRDECASLTSDWQKQLTLLQEERKLLQKDVQLINEEKLNLASEKLLTEKDLECSQEVRLQLEDEKQKLKQQIAMMDSSMFKLSCEDQSCEWVQQKAFLELQVKELESQLEKVKEVQSLERKTARTTQSELWKKEKEFSDLKLDLRIALREKKSVEDMLSTIRIEKEKTVEEMNEGKRLLCDELNDSRIKFEALQDELRTLKIDLSNKQNVILEMTKELEVQKFARAEAQRCLEAEETRVRNAGEETTRAKVQEKVMEQKISSLQSEVDRLRELNEQLQERNSDSLKMLEEQNNLGQNLDLNNKLLRETCSVLEEQLQDFELLMNAYEKREKNLTSEMTNMQMKMDQHLTQTRCAEDALMEERSALREAEDKLKQTKIEISTLRELISTLQAQLEENKSYTESLSEQVSVLEKENEVADLKLQQKSRIIEGLEQEQINLKEELSHYLTSIEHLHVTSFKQTQNLKKVEEERKELQSRFHELSAQLEEQRVHHQYRAVKADATIQQQTKLINFLQHTLSEQSKKKKTLPGRLFGRQKENLPPSVASNPSREFETEHDQHKVVKKQFERTRVLECSNKDLQDGSNNMVLPSEKQLILEPVQHTRLHRFEPRLSMRVGKCSVCLDNIHFGRYAAVCQACNVAAHTKCSLMMPATCGLHSKFVHPSLEIWNAKESSVDDDQSLASKIESYVKLPNQGHSGWENRFLRLQGTNLEVFLSKEKSNMKPDSVFELCPPNTQLRVLSAVPYSDVIGTASSDLPFILKVEIIPKACWSNCVSLLVMAHSFPDKQKWVQALESIVRQRCALSAFQCNTYFGQSIVKFSAEQSSHILDINCCVELKNKLLLIGAGGGLFYLRREVDSAKPVHIKGLSHVHQIVLLPSIGCVMMIAGENRNLVQANILQLENATEAAEWSKPLLDVHPTFPVTCCHLFAANSVPGEDKKTPIILCVATSEKIILLKSNEHNIFIPIKMLDTSDPCSCMHFTPHSVIIGCSKFFEIDLKSFIVEEFVDASDPTLQFLIIGNEQINNFPVAILDISCECSQEPEYLLCFNALGIFVDKNGRRTREDEVKWSHLPLAFVYYQPMLYIFHFDSVEVMKLSPSSFTHEKDTSVPSINYPNQLFIRLYQPRFLGFTKTSNAVVLSTSCQGAIDIRILDASLVCKNYGNLSFTVSEDNASSSFSFSSSLVHSLEDEC